MKLRHNKKRNTAFLYEVLIKEYTKAVVRKEETKKKQIIQILKEFFSKNTPLKKDLENYKTLLESKSSNKDFSIRLMQEVKKDFDSLDRKEIFNEQTKLIKKINETVSNKIFANFISNYKNIATVGQFLSNDGNATQRILLESKVTSIMMSTKEKEKQLLHIDNLTYKTFINKFNETYKNTLRGEQKTLLTNYITSFADNGLGLKVFMNEEIYRLKKEIKANMDKKEFKGKLNLVYEKLDNLSKKPITGQMVEDVFYIQDLVYEVSKL